MTRIAPTSERFPTLFLTVAMLLTATVLAWFGWNTYRSYQAAGSIRERYFRTQALQGVITHLDEVLTMSARMSAATGDLAWEQRYLRFEPLLDGAIKEVIALQPDAYGGAGAGETDSANAKLVAMEHRAFELVRRDSQAAAREVLFSPAYEAQKRTYSEGMAQVAARLAKDAGDATLLADLERTPQAGDVTHAARVIALVRLEAEAVLDQLRPARVA